MVPNALHHAHRPLVGLLVLFLAVVPAALAEECVQTTFDTPEAAAQALIDAALANDDAALKAIYGTKAEGLIQDGTDPMVKRERVGFAKAAAEKLTIEKQDDGTVVLVVGKSDWPLPIPLVQKDGKWVFDAEAGREEILARRIGKNELEAISILRAYIEAQVAYAGADRDGDGVREYAQRVLSSEGKKDGLYWKTDPDSDEEQSPLGPLVESLRKYLSEGSKGAPFNGYYWKILPAQGANAPGGAHSYLINGNMIAGFAMVGVPAKYMETGVMTFLVSHHGKFLEKDLGENEIEIVKAMEIFDPDETWTEVEETEE